MKSKYKYVGSFLKAKNTPIPSIKTNNSKTLISDKDKAEHIAKFFESTFSPKTENLHHFSSRQIPLIDYVYFDEETVYYCLKTLNPKINASSDNLPSIFLIVKIILCNTNHIHPKTLIFTFHYNYSSKSYRILFHKLT